MTDDDELRKLFGHDFHDRTKEQAVMGLKTCTCARGDRICPVHTPMAFGERRTIDVPAKAAREAIPRLLAEKDSLVRAFEVERGSLAAEIESRAADANR